MIMATTMHELVEVIVMRGPAHVSYGDDFFNASVRTKTL
jgi:hypothetical protein